MTTEKDILDGLPAYHDTMLKCGEGCKCKVGAGKTVEIEQQDYVNAITPFRNGCSFRARFEADGKVTLEPGCYLLVNLVQGADRWFLDRWRENGKKPFDVAVTPETLHEMLKVRPCSWCGGSLMANAELTGDALARRPG